MKKKNAGKYIFFEFITNRHFWIEMIFLLFFFIFIVFKFFTYINNMYLYFPNPKQNLFQSTINDLEILI